MKPNKKTLILSKVDINTIINHFGVDKVMDDLIDRLEKMIIEYNPQNTQIPIRDGFNYTIPNLGLVEWMPIYEHGGDIVIKVVGYHPDNPQKYKLPTIISSISTYDSATGHLKSILDGVLLTALRTGASTAVASRLLAMPNSNILGLIGSGAQAVTQLHSLSRVFDLDKVMIYDTDNETMNSFDNRIQALNLNCKISKSTVKDIIETADIICTATSIDVGEGPLFEGIDTLPHAHVNAVGSDFPGKVELPLSLLNKSKVVPDFFAQALKEGECQQMDEADIFDDWIKILKDKKKYEVLKTQRTVFDSTGWALEDMAVANLFTEYALEIEVGSYLQIENLSNDVKNPYASVITTKVTEKELNTSFK